MFSLRELLGGFFIPITQWSHVHSHSRPEEGKTPVEGNKPQCDSLLDESRALAGDTDISEASK